MPHPRTPSVPRRAVREGRRPRETPLETLHRLWRQLSSQERLEFLVEMLTPNERRALQLGFEALDQEGTP
jgi:hypothetical protein